MFAWLNGKKTNIGAAAVALFALAKAVGVHVDPNVEQTVLYVLGAWCGVGVAHKAVKAAGEEQ